MEQILDCKEIALKISNVSFSYKKGTQAISKLNLEVQKGSFGAHMKVSIVNDGPFTILLDENLFN